MKSYRCNLKLLHLLFVIVNCVRCDDINHQTNDINVHFFDLQKIKSILNSEKAFTISNLMNELASKNWTENQHCLTELNTFVHGLNNFDRWAIEGKILQSMSIKCQII